LGIYKLMANFDLEKIKEEFLGERWIGYYILLIFIYLLTFYYATVGVNSKWYNELKQPNWAPGLILIGIIGIVVYIMSFWGLYLAFLKVYENPEENEEIYSFFMITITITTGILAVWTYLFYVAHQVGLATIFMLAAFVLYFAITIELMTLDIWAGLLNAAYLLWLGYFFAFSIWIYIENPVELRGDTL